ncbi:hypothetical protein C8A01DRAFT_19143, partial [Parachaetomium inaequale]
VRDYGALMPTMVYNCAYMPSICKNVEKYLGPFPVSGQEKVFHTDRDPNTGIRSRPAARRHAVCPSSWNNNGRCPEQDQPAWTGYTTQEGRLHKVGPMPGLLSRM